jgi:3D (Asp-Asp-Asp) domain-containing protein
MSQSLRLAFVVGLAALLVSCSTRTSHTPLRSARVSRHMSKVRTTAYTHTEKGGPKNAIGRRLSCHNVQSAAADWSHFPLGTKFRIIDTNEIFQIDDYGTALVGTSTIDLYRPTRLAMRKWGVRHVDIDILEWGSDEMSLQVLTPRARNRTCKRMILALQEKTRTQATQQVFRTF